MSNWKIRKLTETNGNVIYQVRNKDVPNFVFETKDEAIAYQYLNMLNGTFPKQNEPKIPVEDKIFRFPNIPPKPYDAPLPNPVEDKIFRFPNIPPKPYDAPLPNPVVGQCSKCGRDMYQLDMYCCKRDDCPSRTIC